MRPGQDEDTALASAPNPLPNPSYRTRCRTRPLLEADCEFVPLRLRTRVRSKPFLSPRTYRGLLARTPIKSGA